MSSLKLIIDRPKTERLSSRNLDVKELIIKLLSENIDLFSFAVYGSWGSGKTTVCRSVYNLIQSNLEKSKPIDNSKDGVFYVPVWFEAWRYQHEDVIFPALLRTIGAEVAFNIKTTKAVTLGKKLIRSSLAIIKSVAYGAKINVGLKNLGFGAEISGKDILDKFDEELSKLDEVSLTHKGLSQLSKIGQSPYFDAYTTLKCIADEIKIEGQAIKIVIFIDDLDRCLPEVAFKIIEQIKVWLDIDRYVICFALNKNEIDHVIKNYFFSNLYGSVLSNNATSNTVDPLSNIAAEVTSLTTEYLDKIINFGVYLNNVPRSDTKFWHSYKKDFKRVTTHNGYNDESILLGLGEIIKKKEKQASSNTQKLTHRKLFRGFNEFVIEEELQKIKSARENNV